MPLTMPVLGSTVAAAVSALVHAALDGKIGHRAIRIDAGGLQLQRQIDRHRRTDGRYGDRIQRRRSNRQGSARTQAAGGDRDSRRAGGGGSGATLDPEGILATAELLDVQTSAPGNAPVEVSEKIPEAVKVTTSARDGHRRSGMNDDGTPAPGSDGHHIGAAGPAQAAVIVAGPVVLLAVTSPVLLTTAMTSLLVVHVATLVRSRVVPSL